MYQTYLSTVRKMICLSFCKLNQYSPYYEQKNIQFKTVIYKKN